MHADLTIAHLNDAFDNGQTQSNAFMVDFGGSLHLAKAREELRQFIFWNARTSVRNVNYE